MTRKNNLNTYGKGISFLLCVKNSYRENEIRVFKDTHRKKAQSSKTPALTKSRNIDILVVGISNQLFIRGS